MRVSPKVELFILSGCCSLIWDQGFKKKLEIVKLEIQACSVKTGDKNEELEAHFSYQENPKMLKYRVSDVL